MHIFKKYMSSSKKNEIGINYLSEMPFDIISKFVEFLDLKSLVKFTATCKKHRQLFDIGNVDINVAPKIYKGLAYFTGNISKIMCFSDGLENHTKIKKLLLVVTTNCILETCFDFPKLRELELISRCYLYLCHWKLPLLEILNIVECNKCILDECNLFMLKKLSINESRTLPLRYCVIPMMTQIMIYSEFHFFNRLIKLVFPVVCLTQNFETIIEKETMIAQEMRTCGWAKCILEGYYFLCPGCDNPFHVVRNNVFCFVCHKNRILNSKEIRILKSYPNCDVCSIGLKIRMTKYGYSIGVCPKCKTEKIMSKLEMIAAKKINSYSEYPIIYRRK